MPHEWHEQAARLCEAALPQLRPRLVEAMASMAGGPGVPDELADKARGFTIYSLMGLVEHFVTQLKAVDISEIPEDRVIAFCVEQAIGQTNDPFWEIIAETTVMEVAGSCPSKQEMH